MATLSNDLVYAAMAVYAVAMVAFAGALGMTREVLVARTIPVSGLAADSARGTTALLVSSAAPSISHQPSISHDPTTSTPPALERP